MSLFGKKKVVELPKAPRNPNSQVQAEINAALEEAKLPGFNYLNFKQSLKIFS